MRRSLHLVKLADTVAESKRLLQSGYQKNGNWSLGQICRHLRLTIDANVNGYPKWMSLALPIRPVMRWLLLPRLLRGDSPSGIKTASIFVPQNDLNDAAEVELFATSVANFLNHDGRLFPHPGFGRLSKSQFEHFHAAHASHHLSFLSDVDQDVKRAD
ncbi:DUF1569 domain-containing protein [Mariniblastus fucicola]|uniref:DUF1569 domain-containing protein n=1 Tax=Mariniblastus fucicola TaxID=980251 RepID=A0A5B9P1R6_9BACT|nr:DUF1569 domain-containing protein [Mariniblastus fucicola]QEG20447.1 hypothetical protein MFFC18_02950 [Mariniblastus fucicola]